MLKKICVLFMLVLSVSMVEATSYYVSSSSGLNTNNGLSESTPIKTIAKLNTIALNPGDNVYFKSGDYWREPTDAYLIFRSGNESGYITYTSYGTGSKPLFLGSIKLNKTTDWRNLGGYWSYRNMYPTEISNVVLNNTAFAVKKLTIPDMKYGVVGNYYYEHTNIYSRYLYLKSPSNPSTYFGDIELVFAKSIFLVGGNNYTIIDNLALKNGGYLGVDMGLWKGNGGNNIIVRNCDVSNIGGGLSNTPPVRWGNAIQSWDGGSNILIENNRIWEIWDAALTTQSNEGTFTKSNVTFKNNIVWNSVYCFEYFNGKNTITYNITFDHNTCVNNGNNLWYRNGNQRKGYGAGPDCFRFGENKNANITKTNNINLTNNICFNSTKFMLTVDPQWGGIPDDRKHINMDYNLYYQEPTLLFDWLRQNYTTLENFSSFTGKDIHSKSSDPLFVDVENNDFRLYNNSIACTMGSDGGYVGALSCDHYNASNIPYNYQEVNYSQIEGYTDREMRIFQLGYSIGKGTCCVGDCMDAITLPLVINVSQLPFKQYNTISDLPLINDCYDKTHCYWKWN